MSLGDEMRYSHGKCLADCSESAPFIEQDGALCDGNSSLVDPHDSLRGKDELSGTIGHLCQCRPVNDGDPVRTYSYS